jgi:hypothetical protein
MARAANHLTSVVGLLLIAFVILALVGVVRDLAGPLSHGWDFTTAALHGLDQAFLAIILIEVVRTTLSRGRFSTQVLEFLAIGIIAVVRSGLEMAAIAPESTQRGVVVDLAILSLAVLLMSAAYVLVRKRLQEESRLQRLPALGEHAGRVNEREV